MKIELTEEDVAHALAERARGYLQGVTDDWSVHVKVAHRRAVVTFTKPEVDSGSDDRVGGDTDSGANPADGGGAVAGDAAATT